MHLGGKFAACSRVREKDGRFVDSGINWPNERPTVARADDRKIGNACITDYSSGSEFVFTKLINELTCWRVEYMSRRPPSLVRGSVGSWVVDPRDGLLFCGGGVDPRLEANSNIYQIANRDHRSAPETCRLGSILNQA